MDFEEIRALNSEKGQRTSPVDRLLAMQAASPDLLESVSMEMEEADVPCALALFQLPYPILLEGNECVAAGASADAKVALRFEAISLSCDELGQSRIVSGHGEGWRATQVIARTPYWGIRAEFYDAYSACIIGTTFRDRVVVPAERNWRSQHAMTAAGFEANVTGRILRDVKAAMRDFLPAYALSSRQQLPDLPWIYSLFVMPHPGRISLDSDIRPLAHAVFSSSRHSQRSVNQTALQVWMRTRFRHVRQFENELLSLQAVSDAGQPWLAIIGAISLIERRMKLGLPEADAKQKARIGFDGLIRGNHAAVLPMELRRRLLIANGIRNKLVHKLSHQRLMVLEMPADGVFWDRPERVDVEVAVLAEELLRDAFDVYRLLNAQAR